MAEAGAPANRASGSPRLPFIDGLRGIAASAVVVYHLAANVGIGSDVFANSWFGKLSHFGFLGVYIFFVISGFVITLSLGNGPVNGSFFWRYALRRSVRLDPPYWVSMIVALGLAVLAQAFIPSLHKELPSASVVIAHLFYAQNILGMENIVAVYWTLCFEIQFYLVLLLLVWTAQKFAAQLTVAGASRAPVFLILGGGLLLYSLGQLAGFWEPPVAGLFTHSWYAFCAGSVCLLAVQYGWPKSIVFGVLAAIAAAGLWSHNTAAAATVLTALFIFYVTTRGTASRWLAGPVWQYLGRVSYSLYLLHPTIGWTTVSVLKKVLGNATGVWHGLGYIVIGFAVSLVASHLAYLLIEKPSIRWSHKVRLRKEAPVAGASVVTP